MQASPLQLEGYFLKELKFLLADELKEPPRASAVSDRLSIKVEADTTPRDEDPLTWRCELTVESSDDPDKNTPYAFRITFIGFFRVSTEFPSERVKILARTNAPALLYSAAREVLVPLTSRGPYPAIVLPSVTFIEPPSPTQAVSAKAEEDGKIRPARRATRKKMPQKLAEK